MHLAFLHTSPAHVETFGRLVAALAPEARVDHHVDETLLDGARRLGPYHVDVIDRVHAAMEAAAAGGASLVVCTCSTIGAAAEHLLSEAFDSARIDRAMADRAVECGHSILVVAALADTLAPTAALIRDSAARQKLVPAVEMLTVPEAWPRFLAGDLAGYAATIAAAVREAACRAGGIDVVVLAQASMAPATAQLSDLGIEVLASPELGVRAALATLRGQARPRAPAANTGVR